MDFFARFEDARRRWDVLRHPFYTRWERGELSLDELGDYAGQYRHAVVALARTAANAASWEPALREHADEEAAHVALWDSFASASGSGSGRPARAETRDCVRAWTADGIEALAVLYAVESGQPEISETKLAGLVRHYGFAPEGPATAYFRVHAKLDRLHAEQARELIEAKAGADEAERLLAVATGAVAGNWRLLDGVNE
jgi:pyrroloquinoline-quinone synthase